MIRITKKNMLPLLLALAFACGPMATAYAAPLTWTEEEFYEVNIREALDLKGLRGKYTFSLGADKEHYIVSVARGLEDTAYAALKGYGIAMNRIRIQATPSTQPQPIQTAVATGNVNVRSGPGTGYAKLGQLRRGQSVTLEGLFAGSWAQINWGGRTAYVSAGYLRVSSASSPAPDGGATGAAVTTANVNVRNGPGTSYGKVGTLSRGQSVTIWQTTGKWAQIAWGSSGAKAYVHTDYLRFSPVGSPTSDPGIAGIAMTTANVNVRSGPGTKYERMGILNNGQAVEVWGIVNGKWARVTYKGNLKGYVHTDYLKF